MSKFTTLEILSRIQKDLVGRGIMSLVEARRIRIKRTFNYDKITVNLPKFNGHDESLLLIFNYVGDDPSFKVRWAFRDYITEICIWQDEIHPNIPGKNLVTATDPLHWHWNPLKHSDRSADRVLIHPRRSIEVLSQNRFKDYYNQVVLGNLVILFDCTFSTPKNSMSLGFFGK